MLFTTIQPVDFLSTLARFLEKPKMEGETIEEREWVTIGVINLGTVLKYSRASGAIRRAAGVRVVVERATTIVED